MHQDRSAGSVTPLVLRDVRWRLDAPPGIDAEIRVDELRLTPPRLGPFALNVALVPRMEGVELRFTGPGDLRTTVHARHGRLSGDQLRLDGEVRVTGPRERVLRTDRITWKEQSGRLDVPDTFAYSEGGAIFVRAHVTTDVWLEHVSETIRRN